MKKINMGPCGSKNMFQAGVFLFSLTIASLTMATNAVANECFCSGGLCNTVENRLCRDERQYEEFLEIMGFDQSDIDAEHETGCGPRCREAKGRLISDKQRKDREAVYVCKDLKEMKVKKFGMLRWEDQKFYNELQCWNYP